MQYDQLCTTAEHKEQTIKAFGVKMNIKYYIMQLTHDS